jgi:uncharacterized protein involved in exopolysaccharide biosynthesis
VPFDSSESTIAQESPQGNIRESIVRWSGLAPDALPEGLRGMRDVYSKTDTADVNPAAQEEIPGAPFLEEEAGETAAWPRFIAWCRLFWEQRRLLLRWSGIALVIATLTAFLMPRTYESTTRLMPPDDQTGSTVSMMAALAKGTAAATGVSSDLASLAGSALGIRSNAGLFVGVLRSRTVEDRLIDRFDLRKVYGKRYMQDAREKLTKNTAITEDRRSGIITITVSDHDAKRATELAQAYVQQLNQLVNELSTSAAHRERVFLEGRLASVKRELDAAAKDLGEFSSKNATLDVKDQGRAMVEAAATLQGQLIAAESELQGLRQIYTDNNVRVQSVRARIDELQHQLDKMGGQGGVLPAKQQNQLYPSIRELPLLGITYAELYRRNRIQEVVYETLTQQYELAKVQEAKEIPSVKVLDVANVPEKKSFPPRLIFMLLGTALGFSCGIAWIWGRTKWDAVPAEHPGKAFAQEVYAGAAVRVRRAWRHRSRMREKVPFLRARATAAGEKQD